LRQQISALFSRFFVQHFSVSGRATTWRGPGRVVLGSLDVLSIEKGHLRLAGWLNARSGTLHVGGRQVDIAVGLRREDVAQVYGLDPEVGFDLTVPLGELTVRDLRSIRVQIRGQGGAEKTYWKVLRFRRIWWTRFVIKAKFFFAFLRLSPACLGWFMTRDPRFRAQIKRGLNLQTYTIAKSLDERIFYPAPKTINAVSKAKCVTIIVPIYNAFDLLPEMLNRIDKHTDQPWRLVIIEDASPDRRVRPFLRDWVESAMQRGRQVFMLENGVNQGFIKSVNRGFEVALEWDDPVILLNSDAFVPAGWSRRLLGPILESDDVATTTPMSNDAEIFNVPVTCVRSDLPEGAVDSIDLVARGLNGAIELTEAPTGVGFCMGISVEFLRKIPSFDAVFGRGYGEEVDWCQRARNLGGRHLGVPNLFVEHRGGQSFGSEEKLALVTANNAIISERYLGYDSEVQNFIANDPMRSVRLALGMAWATAVTPEDQSVSVYIAHSLGGGAEHYLKDRISRTHLDQGVPAVVLRLGGAVRWQVELITSLGTVAATTQDFETVLELLSPLTRRRVVYSCGVGHPNPMNLPDELLRLNADGRHPIEILFHDFFPISPSYTLLDSDGVFRGTPIAEWTDRAHSQRSPGGQIHSLAEWQSRWGRVVDLAESLIVFSNDSSKHVQTAYPNAVDKIRIAPHGLLSKLPVLPTPTVKRPVVAVLGNIGFQKGAALLKGLSEDLDKLGVGLVVLGNVDPAYLPLPLAQVHGGYVLDKLPELVAQYGITDWLIPSIWPETFSYTTHEALATGYPVHAFDIGAQGEVVARSPSGNVVGFHPDTEPGKSLAVHFEKYFLERKI